MKKIGWQISQMCCGISNHREKKGKSRRVEEGFYFGPYLHGGFVFHSCHSLHMDALSVCHGYTVNNAVNVII